MYWDVPKLIEDGIHSISNCTTGNFMGVFPPIDFWAQILPYKMMKKGDSVSEFFFIDYSEEPSILWI